MQKPTEENLKKISEDSETCSANLNFVLEYFHANATRLPNIKAGTIEAVLRGSIRSLEAITDDSWNMHSYMQEVNSEVVTSSSSNADANTLIDNYLATIDSEMPVNLKMKQHDEITEAMRNNRQQRREKLKCVTCNITSLN